MPRTMLSDNQWIKLKEILLNTGRVYNKYGLRKTVEGMLNRMRIGCQWRDLPSEYGKWDRIYKRFNAWSQNGVLQKIFAYLSADSDAEWLFIDGSIVKAHQDSCGATSNEDEAIGKSVAGNSTKIHLAVDSSGLPIYFELSGGQVHDVVHAQSLIEQSPKSDIVTADRGYDSERLRNFIDSQGSSVNIPRKSNSLVGNYDIDWCLYRYRHLVENTFGKLKRYRGVATRYDKLARNYASTVTLACIMMWLPMYVD